MGFEPFDGLDHLPAERIMELHVAGAREIDVQGLSMVVDDHTPNVLPDTWSILDVIAPRAQELRAVVLECERNSLETCLVAFSELESHLVGTPFYNRDTP